MSALSQRVRRLEEKAGARSGRLFVVFSRGATHSEVRAAFTEAGETVERRDQVLHFETIYEDRDGNAIPPDGPPTVTPPVPRRTSRV